MKQYLYHGSSLANIQTLETRSKLHNSTQKVVYLTDRIPYALVYIWNEKIYHQKWVTCGIRDHLVFYEEQFPNQLAAFYKGVSGYLYCTCQTAAFKPVSQRESMYYSLENVPVDK